MARPTNPVKFIAELSHPNSSTAMTADKEASEALTGRILHTDTVDVSVDQQNSPKWFQKKPLEIGVVLLLLALLGTVVGLAVGLSRSRNSTGVNPECIHALGGGPVKRGGGLDSTVPEYCKKQLHDYADRNRGSYRRVSICLQPLAWHTVLQFACSSHQQQSLPTCSCCCCLHCSCQPCKWSACKALCVQPASLNACALFDIQPSVIVQEVDIAVLAAMSTFGFAHKSSPPIMPSQQQQHMTALRTDESASPLQFSSAVHVSRSLLAGQAAIKRGSEVDVAAADADASVSLCNSLLGLGGPVADAALTEGLLPPEPGRDKVGCSVAGTVNVGGG
jgi:hypothetical protein